MIILLSSIIVIIIIIVLLSLSDVPYDHNLINTIQGNFPKLFCYSLVSKFIFCFLHFEYFAHFANILQIIREYYTNIFQGHLNPRGSGHASAPPRSCYAQHLHFDVDENDDDDDRYCGDNNDQWSRWWWWRYQLDNDDGNGDFDINDENHDYNINDDPETVALVNCTLMSTMLTMRTTYILLTDTVMTTVTSAALWC